MLEEIKTFDKNKLNKCIKKVKECKKKCKKKRKKKKTL